VYTYRPRIPYPVTTTDWLPRRGGSTAITSEYDIVERDALNRQGRQLIDPVKHCRKAQQFARPPEGRRPRSAYLPWVNGIKRLAVGKSVGASRA
jgi:hypothetical protein